MCSKCDKRVTRACSRLIELKYPKDLSKENRASKIHENRIYDILVSENCFSPEEVKFQPYGSQKPPDCLVTCSTCHRHIYFEGKSTRGHSIGLGWNDNYPKATWVYVVTSGRFNATTIALGEQLLSDEQRSLMDDHRERMKSIDNEFKPRYKKLDIGYKFSQVCRWQVNQNGKVKDNLFAPESRRSLREKEVIGKFTNVYNGR